MCLFTWGSMVDSGCIWMGPLNSFHSDTHACWQQLNCTRAPQILYPIRIYVDSSQAVLEHHRCLNSSCHSYLHMYVDIASEVCILADILLLVYMHVFSTSIQPNILTCWLHATPWDLHMSVSSSFHMIEFLEWNRGALTKVALTKVAPVASHSTLSCSDFNIAAACTEAKIVHCLYEEA